MKKTATYSFKTSTMWVFLTSEPKRGFNWGRENIQIKFYGSQVPTSNIFLSAQFSGIMIRCTLVQTVISKLRHCSYSNLTVQVFQKKPKNPKSQFCWWEVGGGLPLLKFVSKTFWLYRKWGCNSNKDICSVSLCQWKENACLLAMYFADNVFAQWKINSCISFMKAPGSHTVHFVTRNEHFISRIDVTYDRYSQALIVDAPRSSLPVFVFNK